MGRANKERKRRRQRERAGRAIPVRASVRRDSDGQNFARRDDRPLRHISYDITTEALPRPDVGGPPPGVREALHDQIKELHGLLFADPAAALTRLQPLIEQYPDWLILNNWQAAAYSRLGDVKKAEDIAQRLYRSHPNYLFAKVNYAQFLLEHGYLDGVANVFDHKFDLKLLYPERDVFHLSEFIAFCGVMVEYFMRRGENTPARNLFGALEHMAPDHEVTESLRTVVNGWLVLQLARRLTERALARLKNPRLGHNPSA